MALRKPTRVSFWKGAKLCWLALTDPTAFAEVERADSKLLESQPVPDSDVRVIRQALSTALLLVIVSASSGFAVGWLIGQAFGPSRVLSFSLQVAAAMILLWATLAVRGWEIQSYSNATLRERVNQWIYRSLCCVGTFLFVMAVGWDAS